MMLLQGLSYCPLLVNSGSDTSEIHEGGSGSYPGCSCSMHSFQIYVLFQLNILSMNLGKYIAGVEISTLDRDLKGSLIAFVMVFIW